MIMSQCDSAKKKLSILNLEADDTRGNHDNLQSIDYPRPQRIRQGRRRWHGKRGESKIVRSRNHLSYLSSCVSRYSILFLLLFNGLCRKMNNSAEIIHRLYGVVCGVVRLIRDA